jgi:uncharacterized protein
MEANMRIGVISDIHDNIWKLAAVLQGLVGVDLVLCLGDMCSPFIVTQIAESFKGPIHIVFGNNDGDKWLITNNAAKAGNVTLHDAFWQVELGGRRLAAVHFPELGKALGAGGQFDVVFYGHNHQQATERIGRTLVVNPGEVMGRFGRSTYVIYDTDSNEANVLQV